ncbi:MAG: long-chain fatty acid--CoA ligase [Firmicutes bacterium]|nr:long-chain fatty acid--CoA ligase [Bacillota bacterium]
MPYNIELEEITLSRALARSAVNRGNMTAINYLGRKISFRELNSLVNSFARALSALGVKKGDKVATLLPNLPQMTIAVYAVFRIGAVVVPNNPLYTERELAHQLSDSDSKIAVGLDVLLPRMLSLKKETGIKKIVTCHINDYLPFPKKQLYPLVGKDMYRKITPQQDVHQFTDLIKEHRNGPVEELSAWNELGAIIYTGGTTGISKGAMMPHSSLSANVQQFASWLLDAKEGEKLLAIYPYFHTAGFTAIQNYSLWGGMEAVLVPRPDPVTVVKMVKQFKPDYLPGVPTIFSGILSNKDFTEMDLSFIKGFFAGAAPVPLDVCNRIFELTGKQITNVYGQTESNPFACISPWGGKVKPETVGLPVPNTDIRIVDIETGEKEMPTGEAGEIAIKGPQVMSGYYKNPKETEQVLRDGWLYTGDIGFFDEEGHLSVVDRKKDLIISGGFNVYPNEVDDILFLHPKIQEACTVGVPDEYRGEMVVAYVVPLSGEEVTEEEIIKYCRESLAAYKIPRKIYFVEELPKSTIGKILRRELRTKVAEEVGEQK